MYRCLPDSIELYYKNGQKRHTNLLFHHSAFTLTSGYNTADWFSFWPEYLFFFFFKVLAALHAFSIYGNMEKGN